MVLRKYFAINQQYFESIITQILFFLYDQLMFPYNVYNIMICVIPTYNVWNVKNSLDIRLSCRIKLVMSEKVLMVFSHFSRTSF